MPFDRNFPLSSASRARREGQAHVQLRRADVHWTESDQLLLAAAREQVLGLHLDLRAQQLVVQVVGDVR